MSGLDVILWDKKNTALINELWFVAGQKKAWHTGTISTTEPLREDPPWNSEEEDPNVKS